ncbi:DUF5655 domain-containing protein [uncultured Slackia sp.]|uniref:DUF5655 domain-containing protein n=1 Tax=uncultured Slackia sp. TaxID=665903 RepID=UPI0026E10427|nr:DUF5655 domain-containing protein [uncultured Slackia sp.]
MTDERTAAFFAGHETALPLYETFEERLFEAFPDAHRKVQKTQITFSNKHVFACVSFLRVRKKADLPSPYIVITLGLSYPLESKRVAAKTEPYPDRWTTHIVVGDEKDIDDELLSWTREAYAFATSK